MLFFSPVEKLTTSKSQNRILSLGHRQSSFRMVRLRTRAGKRQLKEHNQPSQQDQEPSKGSKPSVQSLGYLEVITLQ